MVLGLSPKILSNRLQLAWPDARRGILGCPPETDHVAGMSTRGKAAAAFQELHKSREIQPRWRSHHHVDVRFQYRELDDNDIMTCGGLPEEIIEKRACGCVDHRETIMRRSRQVNEDLVSRHVSNPKVSGCPLGQRRPSTGFSLSKTQRPIDTSNLLRRVNQTSTNMLNQPSETREKAHSGHGATLQHEVEVRL